MAETGIGAIFEERPMSRAQVAAVWVTCALSALDGYDVLSMTFAAPGLTASWGIGRIALGLAFSAGLAGMAFGSLLVAPLADRFGRRPMVVAVLLLMTLGMLMCALSTTVVELATWRVVTGIGIGTMVPIITPLAAEYANARRRTLCIGIMSIGYPIGGTIGGFVAAILLRFFDWRAVFLLGVAAALMLLPLVLRWLPEPPALLLTRRGPRDLQRLNAFLSRCGVPTLSSLPASAASHQSPRRYRALFEHGQALPTVLVAATNAGFVLTVYFILSWMPQMVADAGFAPTSATLVGTVAAAAGVVAAVLRGVAAERMTGRWLTPALLIGTGGATCLFGLAPPNMGALLVLAALVGIFLYSAVVGLYAVIVDAFPPAVRATGTGFVMGLGRLSGAAAPAVAGAMFHAGFGPGWVAASLSCGATGAGLLLLLAGRKNLLAAHGRVG